MKTRRLNSRFALELMGFLVQGSSPGLLLFQVVLEEQAQGQPAQDSAPTTLFNLMLTLEKRGILDFAVTGHKVQRPSAVQRESNQTASQSSTRRSVYTGQTRSKKSRSRLRTLPGTLA